MTGKHHIKILKKPDVTDLAGEKVMIDFDTGKYFMLTGSAGDIWDMLEDGKTADDITAGMLNIYDIDADTCRAGVLSFLGKLADIGFISIDN